MNVPTYLLAQNLNGPRFTTLQVPAPANYSPSNKIETKYFILEIEIFIVNFICNLLKYNSFLN